MPKRSASRITIRVALCTSTPTSITVVETRSLVWLAVKEAMVSDFSDRVLPAVQRRHGHAGQGRFVPELFDDAGHRRQFARPVVALEVRGGRFGLAGTEVAVVVRADLGTDDVDLVAGVDLLPGAGPDAGRPRPGAPRAPPRGW